VASASGRVAEWPSGRVAESPALRQRWTGGYVLLTESVSDFARLVAVRFEAGAHHSGVLIAL
jgi:hypothetical protein